MAATSTSRKVKFNAHDTALGVFASGCSGGCLQSSGYLSDYEGDVVGPGLFLTNASTCWNIPSIIRSADSPKWVATTCISLSVPCVFHAIGVATPYFTPRWSGLFVEGEKIEPSARAGVQCCASHPRSLEVQQ